MQSYTVLLVMLICFFSAPFYCDFPLVVPAEVRPVFCPCLGTVERKSLCFQGALPQVKWWPVSHSLPRLAWLPTSCWERVPSARGITSTQVSSLALGRAKPFRNWAGWQFYTVKESPWHWGSGHVGKSLRTVKVFTRIKHSLAKLSLGGCRWGIIMHIRIHCIAL